MEGPKERENGKRKSDLLPLAGLDGDLVNFDTWNNKSHKYHSEIGGSYGRTRR